MITLNFDIFDIEIVNDPKYGLGSSDNIFTYDQVYNDEESFTYKSINHGIKIYKKGELYKSAILCAVGGATAIHKKSAIIDNDDIYICCADKVFCLKLPDLTLNWMTKTDFSTCFGIYKTDNGFFTHGELQITRLDKNGNIVWETGLKDIIVNIDGDKECFILQDNFIELMDFNSEKYKLDFNGKFI